MRGSIRTTLLALVLPLTLVTIGQSGARIADLVTIRQDIAGARDSAFRSIYTERYAGQLHDLLRVSFDHLAGRGAGLEAIAAARDRAMDTLDRLRSFVGEPAAVDAGSGITLDTLAEWEETQEQIDLHFSRALALARGGDGARARRLVMDELEVLIQGRIFSSIDLKVQGEQELLERYQVRIMRATEGWLARAVGVIDLQQRLLPRVYEATAAERFARSATAELKAFTHYLLGGKAFDPSHGVAASQAIAQLSQLQRIREAEGVNEGPAPAGEPGATYLLILDAYAKTRALPEASRRSNAGALLQRLDDAFARSMLAHTNAIVWDHEQAIGREMARLEQLAQVLTLFTGAMGLVALLVALGSPWLASRLLIRPIRDLLDTVSRFREGQKDARPRTRGMNELGQLAHSLGGMLDELQESDRKMRSLALFDSTTGLPNRQFFQEHLSGSLVTAGLQGRAMGLLTLHLAGLEQVNETLGHSAGDELIRQVAIRVRDSVRLSDVVARPSDEDRDAEVSHLGGYEFTILLTKIAKPADAAIAAQRVLEKLVEPFEVRDREIVVTTSIGIGVYPQDGGEADALLRNSRAAMNEARKRGRDIYQFFSESMNTANSRKLHIQSRLSGAIARGDLALHYQPIRNSAHGELTGAEALLRWTDAEMGPIGPDEFIPLAEQVGLISEIGGWVLSEACAQIRAWQDAGFPSLRISVNVSARQLRDPNWVETVAGTIRENGVSPASLDFEITETTVLEDDAKTVVALSQLSEMGVGIVLDDFGTGYSSLSHLRRLPISRVKIDRSFVSEITESESGAALAGAIVTLAHGLQLEVVAEGVETHEQANFLRRRRCDELQGYLISRPVAAKEFEGLMTRQKQE